jgi:hypothetical protein
MYLQLHDGPGMASIQGVQDIPLPQALKVDQRQALIQAIPVALEYIQKQIAKRQEALPDEVDMQGKQMAGPLAILLNIAANLPQIIQGLQAVANQVPLLVFNQRVMAAYNANRYNVKNLNNLNRAQINDQLKVISADLLNANQAGDQQQAAVLARFSQVYQLRLSMLPVIPRNALLIGGALLAYYFIKK